MKEIAFAINPQASKEQGCLVLDLLEVVKEGYAYQLPLKCEDKSPSHWRSLAISSTESDVVTFLFKEELQFQQRTMKSSSIEGTRMSRVRISPSQTAQAFKLLAATQKLFCKGKHLAIDLYGPAEFYYAADPQASGALSVEGRLRWRTTDIALTACDAVGPGKPHWFVYGVSLKMISTSLSWKKLQEALQSPLILAGGAKQVFLSDIDPEDPETPQLMMGEGGIAAESIQESGPLPLLLLKDRWGAFADLWMDYGHRQTVARHDSQLVLKDSKGKVLLKRDLKAEDNWEKDLLETDFIKKIVDTSHYYCPMDCVAKSLTFLLEVGWEIHDWQGRRVVKQTGWGLDFAEIPQMITVKGHLNYDTHQADVSAVLGAFNRREQFIQLSSDTVGLLPIGEGKQALQDLAEESEMVGQEVRIKKSRFGSLEPLWEHASSSSSLTVLKEKWQNFTGIEEALPGSAFQGQLRPYQQQGVNWLSFLHDYGFHGILADEMGLGKTIQILAFLSRLPKRGIPHLIILPTSLLFNWKNEISRFLPSFKTIVHQGSNRAAVAATLAAADVILTSYTTLRIDLSLFQSIAFACLILDEAQMIKNASTQTAQAVCQLRGEMRLCLTGTPIENHRGELWSHFHFLIPDLLGSQESFDAAMQAAESDNRYLERIKRKIAPFILRRCKKEVATDLPERIDQVVWVEMGEEQRMAYDSLLAGFKSGLLKKVELEGIGKHRMEVLEAILRLRQVCCHPLLVSSLLNTPSLESAKYDALMQDLETIVEEEHKVLVYSQFTSMLKLLTRGADERGWNYCYLDGETKNREEVVRQFQEERARSIFFISLKAGGVGLNLTAADYVFLYDPWWNEAVEEQAINRAHRIGRESHVIAKRFVMAESVEERIMKMKEAKRAMIDELFEAGKGSTEITMEDLQFLLT